MLFGTRGLIHASLVRPCKLLEDFGAKLYTIGAKRFSQHYKQCIDPKGERFLMEGKKKILIISFLDCIHGPDITKAWEGNERQLRKRSRGNSHNV